MHTCQKQIKMNRINLLILSLFFTSVGFGQKYVSKNGHVKFFSAAPTENIEANNNQVNAALDLSNGNLVFKVLIKSFEFEKALMQEHFNENYMESDKFPNSTFSGKVSNLQDIDFSKDGEYKAKVKGSLTMHGVTKEVEHEGSFKVEGSSVKCHAIFPVKVGDYNIKIPKTVVDNIAETIEVTVDVKMDKM